MKKYFNNLTYIFFAVSMVLFFYLFLHLHVRGIGGPFPQRTRGPLAKYEYYRLGELPKWESQIDPNPATGRTSIEDLIDKKKVPVIRFGNPFEEKVISETNSNVDF